MILSLVEKSSELQETSKNPYASYCNFHIRYCTVWPMNDYDLIVGENGVGSRFD